MVTHYLLILLEIEVLEIACAVAKFHEWSVCISIFEAHANNLVRLTEHTHYLNPITGGETSSVTIVKAGANARQVHPIDQNRGLERPYERCHF